MLYLVRVLHMPDGECRYNTVVETAAGMVVGTEPFLSEMHSMILVDEVFLTVDYTGIPRCNAAENNPLYACSVGCDGVLKRLE